MPLSKSARLVLLAIQQQTDHSYAALQTSAGVARATLASALQELIAAGSITAIKSFGKPARYTITAPSPAAGSITAGESSAGSITDDSSECAPLVHSFSSSVVQKFNSSKVQFSALHDDEDVLKENNSSSCNANQTSELLNKRAAFKAQIVHLLDEYLIKGKKRDQLAEAIANLQDAPETILENVRKIRAGAVERATTSAVGLTVYILSEYASTGQIALFDVPVPESCRAKGRKGGLQRRPQIHYTDEQRAAAYQRISQERLARAASPLPASPLPPQVILRGGVGGGLNVKGGDGIATGAAITPPTPEHTRAWEAAKRAVAGQMARGNFLVFLNAAQLAAVDGDRAHIVAPNQYAVEWLANRLSGPLAAAWQTHTGAPITLTFSVKQLEAAHV